MEIPPPKSLEQPLYVPNKTLMGPGPSNCTQRVLEALSNPILGHLHPECLQIMDEIKSGIKYIYQTSNNATMCISGSGHAGMEAAMCNLVEDNDVVLFGSTGYWAHRASEVATCYGAVPRIVEAANGRSLTVDQIAKAFNEHKPKVFFIAQGDSATGVLQSNIKEIGELCLRYDCLLVVDVVASLGGTEFLMDAWNVDVAYVGSQKVIGAPAGITPISFSKRAVQRITSRKSKPKSFYLNVMLIGQYWNCFDTPRIYHHTISSTLLYGLREALAQICSQGLNKVVRRHQECSHRLQNGIAAMGLEMFVSNVNDRLPTVNTVKIPDGVDWKSVSNFAMEKYKLEISGGLGPTAGQIFRIGLMGENATFEKVDLILNILQEAIQSTKLLEKAKL